MNHPRVRRRTAGSAVLLVVLAVSAVSQAASAQPNRVTPIQHLVIIMQENHSFDNYFGTYPTANGTLVDNITSRLALANGIPNGVCLSYVVGCVSPHLTTTGEPENPVEGQSVYEADYAPGSGFPLSSGPQSMVYFDYHSIPAYWDYAEEYALADNYYAAVLGTTTPNRLMLLTGDTPVSFNQGPPPYVSFNSTIFAQLQRAGVSWGYYDFVGSTNDTESTYPLNYITGLQDFRGHIRDVSALSAELASNSGLPDVSFVSFLGKGGLDEHPPDSPAAGEMQTVSVINAIMESSFWNSTAIFLTYDEGGGFYDHVAPPQTYSIDHNFNMPLQGLGQRVPLLVISPFSRTNYVSHTQMSHLSLLHFIEYNWNIPALDSLVSSAKLPIDFFNFSQPLRRPVVLGTEGLISYPVAFQAVSTVNSSGGWNPGWQFAIVAGPFAVVAISVIWLSMRTRNKKSTQRAAQTH